MTQRTYTVYLCDQCGMETDQPIEITEQGIVNHFDNLDCVKVWTKDKIEAKVGE